MPNIYISNYAGFDFKKAERFGDKVYNITRGFIDVKSVAQINAMVIDVIKKANKEDYLLLAGPTILNAIIVFLWLKYHGMCKTLVWKRKKDIDGDYDEVILLDFNFDSSVTGITSDGGNSQENS